MKNNRLQSLFGQKSDRLLSVYFTAGYPRLDSTADVICALAAGGVDIIEVGVPFSDPMADGRVIQESSSVALRNGMTLKLLFSQVKEARRTVPDTPIVLMGYLNPMMRFGTRRLFEVCRDSGVDAIIIPDLSFNEYVRNYRQLSGEFDIPMIMLITPETSDERIRMIDDHCDGFIYMVSAAATTGTRDKFGPGQKAYFRRISGMSLKHKRLIGFGISNSDTLADAWRYSSGAIIGSLFIKCLSAEPTPRAAVERLLKSLS